MSYIYKITNQINGKCYIGKTNSSIEKRFKEHKHDAQSKTKGIRPLYRAFNKYGVKNFSIETIEQCSEEESSDREIYWIKYYNSYHFGYNATRGGDGKSYVDHKAIIKAYLEGKITPEIAHEFNCSEDTVRHVLRDNGYTLLTKEISRKKQGIPVQQLDMNCNVIRTFNSMSEAAEALSISSSGIGNCCKGKSKKCGGFQWRYADETGKQRSALNKISLKKPPKEELKKLIRYNSWSKIGREYSVCPTTIKRWARGYNLPDTKEEINLYSDEEWDNL